MGRTKTRDASALLIDQHRCSFILDAFAKGAEECAKLIAVDDVAAEDDEAPRPRFTKEAPLIRRQFRSETAINRARTHDEAVIARAGNSPPRPLISGRFQAPISCPGTGPCGGDTTCLSRPDRPLSRRADTPMPHRVWI